MVLILVNLLEFFVSVLIFTHLEMSIGPPYARYIILTDLTVINSCISGDLTKSIALIPPEWNRSWSRSRKKRRRRTCSVLSENCVCTSIVYFVFMNLWLNILPTCSYIVLSSVLVPFLPSTTKASPVSPNSKVQNMKKWPKYIWKLIFLS